MAIGGYRGCDHDLRLGLESGLGLELGLGLESLCVVWRLVGSVCCDDDLLVVDEPIRVRVRVRVTTSWVIGLGLELGLGLRPRG